MSLEWGGALDSVVGRLRVVLGCSAPQQSGSWHRQSSRRDDGEGEAREIYEGRHTGRRRHC